MNRTMHAQVQQAEDRLRSAMLSSDVPALELLLAPGLLFTNHLGHLQTRHDDLEAYRSGTLRITSLVPSEQQIRVVKEIAIVSVRVQIEGTYNGQPATGTLRFTRVWALSPSATWQVLAAHATALA